MCQVSEKAAVNLRAVNLTGANCTPQKCEDILQGKYNFVYVVSVSSANETFVPKLTVDCLILNDRVQKLP